VRSNQGGKLLVGSGEVLFLQYVLHAEVLKDMNTANKNTAIILRSVRLLDGEENAEKSQVLYSLQT
jgi:hypothetical protein